MKRFLLLLVLGVVFFAAAAQAGDGDTGVGGAVLKAARGVMSSSSVLARYYKKVKNVNRLTLARAKVINSVLQCGKEILGSFFAGADLIMESKTLIVYENDHIGASKLRFALLKKFPSWDPSQRVTWVWTPDVGSRATEAAWSPVSTTYVHGGKNAGKQPTYSNRVLIEKLHTCTKKVPKAVKEELQKEQETADPCGPLKDIPADSGECRFMGGTCVDEDATCPTGTALGKTPTSGENYCADDDFKCCVGSDAPKKRELAGGCCMLPSKCNAGRIVKYGWCEKDEEVFCTAPVGNAERVKTCPLGKWPNVYEYLVEGKIHALKKQFDSRGNKHGGDGASAWQNIVDAGFGYPVRHSAYGKAPGEFHESSEVCLDIRMAAFIVKAVEAGHSMTINAIAGASHATNSVHYLGRVLDIGKFDGTVLSNSKKAKEICQMGKDNGAGTIFNKNWCSTDTCKDHDNWVHMQWN